MLRSTQETEFVINGFRYACQLWGDENEYPVIALHGWLDNAATFGVLAPKLSGLQILAPDLAGHGLTDHRPSLVAYPLWSEISEIFHMADEMGWEKFALLGHSRGGMMAQLVASIYPERITHLISLDCLSPFTRKPEETPQQIKNSIEEIKRRVKRPLSLYNDYEKAIKARCMSEVIKVKKSSAELLATRGLSDTDAGYHWHSDGKLWGATEFSLNKGQVDAFLNNITAKFLVMIGKEGITKNLRSDLNFDEILGNLVKITNATVKYYDDGHYLHMEKAVDEVAKDILDFVLD
jgi:pimeloyl-ACP methyl ester carboxylesterase